MNVSIRSCLTLFRLASLIVNIVLQSKQQCLNIFHVYKLISTELWHCVTCDFKTKSHYFFVHQTTVLQIKS